MNNHSKHPFLILSAIFILSYTMLKGFLSDVGSRLLSTGLANVLIILIFLIAGFYILIKAADDLVKILVYFSSFLGFSQFATSFVVFGVAAILPEFSISVDSALKGESSFALGLLLGSNIADLALVLGIVAIFAGSVSVRSKLVQGNFNFFLLMMALPLLLLVDGGLSQTDGVILLAAFAYYLTLMIRKRRSVSEIIRKTESHPFELAKYSLLALLSLWILFSSANIVAENGISLSNAIGVPSIFIAILIAAGTCLPELTFSLAAIREGKEELGVGDVLGNVAMDATFSLGIVSLISPIYPSQMQIAMLTAASMLVVAIMAINFIRSGRVLDRKEGILLILLYLVFIAAQFAMERSIMGST